MPEIIFPESPVDLIASAQRGNMKILPLYKYDVHYLEKTSAGIGIAELKAMAWFNKSIREPAPAPILDETLCSQDVKPPVPSNEAWVVDTIEIAFIPDNPHTIFADWAVYHMLSKGLAKLIQDRDEILKFHLDRMNVSTDPSIDYSVRYNESFIDSSTRGIQRSPQFSSVYCPETPLYFRPQNRFHFQYIPSPHAFESLFVPSFPEGTVCLETGLMIRMALRGRLYRPLYIQT